MIYPLLPVFFSGLVPPALVAVYIGLMEGLAESTASLLKFYAGRLSDHFNWRKPLALVGHAISSDVRPFSAIAAAGWVIYAAVYIAMPFASHFGTVCALLFFYGVYYGMTEGAERALVADFGAARDRGRTYGWYHGAVGFATLPASLMFDRS